VLAKFHPCQIGLSSFGGTRVEVEVEQEKEDDDDEEDVADRTDEYASGTFFS